MWSRDVIVARQQIAARANEMRQKNAAHFDEGKIDRTGFMLTAKQIEYWQDMLVNHIQNMSVLNALMESIEMHIDRR